MTDIGAYARLLGATLDGDLLRLPFGGAVEGRPGYLHGGAIAGLAEAAGMTLALRAVGEGFGLTTITVDYLRGGGPAESFAGAKLIRHGRRVVHVEARVWQDDPGRPIAIARMTLVRRAGAD